MLRQDTIRSKPARQPKELRGKVARGSIASHSGGYPSRVDTSRDICYSYTTRRRNIAFRIDSIKDIPKG